jgi:DNA-binding transcriptional regulator YiaG
MTANPLTPLDALRDLLDATLLDIDTSDADLQWTAAVAQAKSTLDHYTRNGWDGPSVKARRIAAGLSQRELADRTGFGLTTIRNWEQGRSRPSKVSMSVLWPILAQPHEREQS